MPSYIWERQAWPNFRWDGDQLLPSVAEARFQQGQFLQLMAAAGFDTRLQSEFEATCDDVIKTSVIEGEILNPASVRSSIARRLGIPDGGLMTEDRRVEGVVDMILDATKNYAAPLTAERIFGWHAALFPTGYSGKDKIDIAQWRTDRDGTMQVISNIYSATPTIHYTAPPAARVSNEMQQFLAWFNGSRGRVEPLVRAGLAHLWFVTIHPMDDGNGRIARAVADLAIGQMEQSGQRFYSMSSQIAREKKQYYDMLERTQKGNLDITEWLVWFCGCYARAIQAAKVTVENVFAKTMFWEAHNHLNFSERHRKVLKKLLEDFEGFITTKRWSSICGCSIDTSQRDINQLVEYGLLEKNPGGSKKTSYRFNWPQEPAKE